ncbi:class I SAM-dependent methyltransferase [Nostoc flagelliforme FACHB-838]|uniref:Class I SAM-dependent methyltransferase n=1 Tax=Nostoc flagelliforme FACHB-838 TaxID=2692904 RepID=A0ABR8DYP9_9NOSO|nr:class I SAM-dependent methyltransferase [Nostoc flagelliforme]MBD2534564.1 class I SAM-dependent methyltransferase [Nostoc flagelliforme FACHB-838]
MTTDVIQQQIEYYRARANEYDQWFYRTGRYDRDEELNQRWFDEVAIVKTALHQIEPVEHILELACGTGIWTQELLQKGQKITAIDAVSEVIEINQRKLQSPKVNYQQWDLFTWEPHQQYDLVFFSFWLSHVPPIELNSFFQKVSRSVRPGGQIFMIDSRFEPTSTAKDHILKNDENLYKMRKLNDGQEFKIVKIFYRTDELNNELVKAKFQAEVKLTDNYFIYAYGQKIT